MIQRKNALGEIGKIGKFGSNYEAHKSQFERILASLGMVFNNVNYSSLGNMVKLRENPWNFNTKQIQQCICGRGNTPAYGKNLKLCGQSAAKFLYDRNAVQRANVHGKRKISIPLLFLRCALTHTEMCFALNSYGCKAKVYDSENKCSE
jgi:hypothetical protein